MLKKFLAVVLTVCMLAGTVVAGTAFAAGTPLDTEKLAELQGLGIAPDDVKPNGTVNRGDFATWFAGFYTDDIESYPAVEPGFADINGKYQQAVSILENYKLIDGNAENFEPRKPLLLEHAAKIAVNALGYSFMAYERGGYPGGYVRTAQELGLLRGVSASTGDNMKTPDVTNFIYNCLDVAALEPISFGEMVSLEAKEGRTLLAAYRHIYPYEGVVADDSVTSLTGRSAVKEGQMMVGEYVFEAGNADAEYLLGKNVKLYYKDEDRKTYPIVYIQEKDNKTLTLDSESFVSIDDGCSTISYALPEMTKTSKISLSPSTKVIYNGRACPDYTADDFKIKSGNIELIENNKNGDYDVVKITSYQTMAVNYRVMSTGKVINLYTYDDGFKEIVLSPATEQKISIYKNGEEIPLSKIKEGDILSVAASRPGSEQKITVIVSQDAVEGVAEEINTENMELTVGGKAYKLAAVYTEALDAADPKAKRIDVGQKYRFLLDSEGKIAYVTGAAENEYMYAYLTGASLEKPFGDSVSLKLFTEKSEWITPALSKNVRLNKGETAANPKLVYNTLTEETGSGRQAVRQLLKVKLNPKQEISEIETATLSNTPQNDKFIVSSPRSGSYLYRSRSIGLDTFLSNDTLIFLVPGEGVADIESNYAVRHIDYIQEKAYNNFYAYDSDEYNFAKALLFNQSKEDLASAGAGSSFFVVDRVGKCVMHDEVVPYVSGSMGDYAKITLYAEDDKLLDKLRRGDVLQPAISSSGYINDYVLWWTRDELGEKGDKTIIGEEEKTHSITVNDSTVTGHVTNIDPAGERLRMSYSDGSLVLRPSANTPIVIVDLSNDSLQYGSLRDIETGDYLVTRTLSWSVQEIVVVRFK